MAGGGDPPLQMAFLGAGQPPPLQVILNLFLEKFIEFEKIANHIQKKYETCALSLLWHVEL